MVLQPHVHHDHPPYPYWYGGVDVVSKVIDIKTSTPPERRASPLVYVTPRMSVFFMDIPPTWFDATSEMYSLFHCHYKVHRILAASY